VQAEKERIKKKTITKRKTKGREYLRNCNKKCNKIKRIIAEFSFLWISSPARPLWTYIPAAVVGYGISHGTRFATPTTRQ
jgi:hypothetical protein